ncbi:MAG: hypothetical protein GY726_16335, partial [Proteobacteria bacterium]|nr:hypothetical protein [Pseudomonadota bacterium]
MPKYQRLPAAFLTLLILVANPLLAQSNTGSFPNPMLDQARTLYDPMRRETRRAYNQYDGYRQRQYRPVQRPYPQRRTQYRPREQRYVPDNYQREYRRSYERFAQYQRRFNNRKWYPDLQPSSLHDIEPGFNTLPETEQSRNLQTTLPECPAEAVPVPVFDADKDGITDQIDECPQTAANTAVDTYGC